MKVTDLKKNECIHCETEEQAKAICKLMHEAGLKWKGGQSYLSKNYYGNCKSETCYFPIDGQYDELSYAKEENYKIYKAEQFINQKQEVMSTVVNINTNTSEINITPKEGFEIDLENSDLKNGKVVFKEVKEKYPTEFKDLETDTFKLSTKYGHKLSILNTLLHFRDEYNRIDGFEEGFRFREDNWCISNYYNKLNISCWTLPNGIMHFGKEETAKLFLKNFEKQLEQIKEFL
jgi:archaellum component FlaF (FlaF/FlaG flagellin family)